MTVAESYNRNANPNLFAFGNIAAFVIFDIFLTQQVFCFFQVRLEVLAGLEQRPNRHGE